MPLRDDGLTAVFAGHAVDIERLRAAGWSCAEQKPAKSRSKRPPKKRNPTWVHGIEPAFDSCEPVKLYVLLEVGPDELIVEVRTCITVIRPWARIEEMPVGLRYPDDEEAKRKIRAVLTDEARRRIETREADASAESLCIPMLIDLIGRPDSCGQAKYLIDRFQLRRSPTLFDDGYSWCNNASRVQLMTDPLGRIKVVFLTPGERDSISGTVRATASRDSIRRVLGPPTRSDAAARSDRFDRNVAISSEYAPDGDRTTKWTLMSRDAAP